MNATTKITQKQIDTVNQGVIVDGLFGVYVPQNLAYTIKDHCPEALQAVREQCPNDTLDVLIAGPEHDDYWEAFDEILQITFNMAMPWGEITYGLYCNDSVFLLDLNALEALEGDGPRLFWDAFAG